MIRTKNLIEDCCEMIKYTAVHLHRSVLVVHLYLTIYYPYNSNQRKDPQMDLMNDQTVAEAVKQHEDKLSSLRTPPSAEEAWIRLTKLDNYELGELLPSDTRVGRIERVVKGGLPTGYGFIRSGHGDVFVPPSLMDEVDDDDARVACHVVDGPRGARADKIAVLGDYLKWHRDELTVAMQRSILKDDAETLRNLEVYDPTCGWEEMKAKCRALGLNLIEVSRKRETFNYGGRGTDEYKFDGPVDVETADKVLDVLNARHGEPDNGCPYDHGYDRITTTATGFTNNWHGPWTD